MTFEEHNVQFLQNQRITNKAYLEKLQPEDIEFYELISDRVTSSNALPFDIPAKTVFQLIVKGLKFFWEWYDQGTEERTVHLPYNEILKAKGTKFNRLVQLPNGIEAVIGWQEIGGGIIGDNVTQYLNYALLQNLKTGATFSDARMDSRGAYKENVTSMTNIITSLYEIQSWKSTFSRTIRATYNKHSQIFSIRSEIKSGMILDCLVRLPPENMYTYQLFEDYVVASVEEQLGKIVSMFDFKYPGGIQPDFKSISDDGKTERERIEEFLRDANTGVMMLGD